MGANLRLRYCQALAPIFIFLGFLYASTLIPHTTVEDDPNGFSKVSGFYGPGAFIAWYLSCLSAAITTLQSFGDTSKSHYIDPNLLAVIGYPIVAFVDVFRRALKGTHDASSYAASTVLSMALTLSLSVFELSWSLKEDGPVSYQSYIWAILFDISALGLYTTLVGPRSIPSFARLYFQTLLGFFSFLPSIKTVPSASSLDAYINFGMNIIVHLSLSAIVGFTFKGGPLGPGGATMLLIPRTTAKLMDIDQAATLGIATVVLVWQWRNPFLRLLRFAWRYLIEDRL